LLLFKSLPTPEIIPIKKPTIVGFLVNWHPVGEAILMPVNPPQDRATILGPHKIGYEVSLG